MAVAVNVEYAVQESITNIRRNFFLSVAAILVVAVGLFQFGAISLLQHSIARVTDLLTGKVSVSVFLVDGVSDDLKKEIEDDIGEMPEVSTVAFESKAEAYENFKRLFANQPEILQNASPDALPESFRIRLKDPRTFTVIRDRLEGRPGIRTIRDERETVKKIFSFTDKLHRAAVGMAVIVGLAALVQIATTIRMAIYARRREIQIMKLVGATNWFIRVPFMLEGVAQGAVGAAIAMVLLLVLKPAIASISPEALSDFRLEITLGDLLSQGGVLLAVGMFVGAVGSLVGLRRFLDV